VVYSWERTYLFKYCLVRVNSTTVNVLNFWVAVLGIEIFFVQNIKTT